MASASTVEIMSETAAPAHSSGSPLEPAGRKLLRLEVRNSQVPIERKPEWIKTRLKTGPEYTELKSQRRVHWSPPMRKVASRSSQHS